MTVRILGLDKALPGEPIPQMGLLELACRFNATDRAQRARLRRIYSGSTIDQRHSVLSLTHDQPADPIRAILEFYGDPGQAHAPTTRQRMAIYEEQALPLATRACHEALRDSRLKPNAITHLVTVSCTGFNAPGLDLGLIDTLGLSPSVGRTHIGFMGCHAAINGLRVAEALCAADPARRVLLCCTELCTLHFQKGLDAQDAVANAIFADGGASAVLGNDERAADNPTDAPTVRAFYSTRLASTRSMMAWQIGDTGFRMRLDSAVPRVVEQHLPEALQRWLATLQLKPSDIGGWIIHPGGPRIIDAVETALALTPDATQYSRDVLRDHGNMSSPTVLFILDRLRQRRVPGPWVMLGFGPGLVIEAALFDAPRT